MQLRFSAPPPWRVSTRDALGRKACFGCREWKPVAEFNVDNKQSDHLSSNCRQCLLSDKRYRLFGITAAQYRARLSAQGDVCAICGSEPADKALAVDHDHRCCPGPRSCSRCVRGLLCASCNLALGLARHDPTRLHAMLVYLGGRRVSVSLDRPVHRVARRRVARRPALRAARSRPPLHPASGSGQRALGRGRGRILR